MTCIRCKHDSAKKFGKYGRHRIQRYRCISRKATFSEPKPETGMGNMRIAREDAIRVLQCLLEGCSIRSTERMTGLHRDTIMSLLVEAGGFCAQLLNDRLRNLSCKFVESDEIWSYLMKKRRNVRDDDPAEWGDQWVFVALDADTKLVVSFAVGKRTAATTAAFVRDLASRVNGRIQLTTDGFKFYQDAVENAFGSDIDFAQLVKLFGDFGQHDTAARYSPGKITEVISKVRQGNPDQSKISTSFVERQNLTMRMQLRRFTRLTNAFSRKLENHIAAVSLHFAYYNFCRVHKTLRVTPAMQAGITDHIWSIEDLLVQNIGA